MMLKKETCAAEEGKDDQSCESEKFDQRNYHITERMYDLAAEIYGTSISTYVLDLLFDEKVQLTKRQEKH